jgi:hypothetical protein
MNRRREIGSVIFVAPVVRRNAGQPTYGPAGPQRSGQEQSFRRWWFRAANQAGRNLAFAWLPRQCGLSAARMAYVTCCIGRCRKTRPGAAYAGSLMRRALCMAIRGTAVDARSVLLRHVVQGDRGLAASEGLARKPPAPRQNEGKEENPTVAAPSHRLTYHSRPASSIECTTRTSRTSRTST